MVTSTDWEETNQYAHPSLGACKIWLSPIELGLGHLTVMRWHEEVPEQPK
jgi:hypothetical protein